MFPSILNLAPFQGDALNGTCYPGLKPRAETVVPLGQKAAELTTPVSSGQSSCTESLSRPLGQKLRTESDPDFCEIVNSALTRSQLYLPHRFVTAIVTASRTASCRIAHWN